MLQNEEDKALTETQPEAGEAPVGAPAPDKAEAPEMAQVVEASQPAAGEAPASEKAPEAETPTAEASAAEETPVTGAPAPDKGKAKKIWSWLADSCIVTMLLALVLIDVGRTLGVHICGVVSEHAGIEPDIWQTMYVYVAFTGIWIVMVLYMLLTKKNRPILKALGPKPRGNNLKGLGTGLLIGFCMNLFCAVVAMANKDLMLSFSRFDFKGLLLLMIVIFIQSSAEELVCRVFIYQRLVKRFKNVWIAAVLNSALFVVLHLLNPGFTWISGTVIMFSGLLFSVMVIYMDSSWAAMGAHAAWNYTQNILLGLPNSGLVVPFSLFKVDAVSDSWAYSVKFGLEGGFTAAFVMGATMVMIIIWGIRHKKQPCDVWATNK